MALAAYRHLLRSSRIAFQGDLRVLHAARQTARQNFDGNLSLSPSSAEVAAGIAHAEDVAHVLRRHVVQGERVGEEAVEQGGRYHLRIHADIERGNNSTIKTAGKKSAKETTTTGECCGGECR